MASLCEGGNEPSGSLKAICKALYKLRGGESTAQVKGMGHLTRKPSLAQKLVRVVKSIPPYASVFLAVSWLRESEQVSDFKNVIQVAFDFSALQCGSEDRSGVASAIETLVVSWDQLLYPSVVELCRLGIEPRVTDVFSSSSLPKRSREREGGREREEAGEREGGGGSERDRERGRERGGEEGMEGGGGGEGEG
ncbi:hypothetical protein ANN_18182 [Periplaneta americana]|uniref:Uncharacterized protein n=1 Tax=Periplaneta americana TaxID=6978 RepID=A0ABQ8SN14_PERAM|nr:hypothetical protein ANN_18182 [Periplaneta americana]